MIQFLRLSLIAFLVVGISSAQAQTVIYSQDFENGLGDMISIDNDGRVVDGNLNLPSEWSVIELNDGTFAAASPSWFSPVGRADDWLITPQITIEPGSVVEWNASSLNAEYPDGYNVLVSTTDTELGSFTAALTIQAEDVVARDRILELDEYAGMPIYIAFQNNTNDGLALLIDDIVVRTTKAIDARIPSLELSNTNFVGAGFEILTGLAGEKAVIFDIFNAGSDDIKNLEVTFTLDGQEYVETRDISIPLGQTYNFISQNKHNYVTGDNQAYSIDKVVVNGEQLDISESNTVTILPPVPAYEAKDSKGEIVNVHSLLEEGKTVILDFFASWCGPCQTATPMLEAWYQANGGGDGNMEVLGIDIEESDTDAIVNGLGWGASYPKISYQPINELYWVHFTQNHDLNEGFIPFFIALCPSAGDVAESELNVNLIGVPPTGSFDVWQPNHDDCIARFVDVEDIEKLESMTVFPNPTTENITVDLQFGELTDFTMAITTIEGKQVRQYGNFSTTELNMNIDISDIAEGIYILQVSTPTGQRNHKFVKM